MALTDWTNDRIGPPLLREGMAWFECKIVDEHPAGDHLLVVGRVIDGKLIDSEAEPMCYRETGAMDGASTLYPDVFGEVMTHLLRTLTSLDQYADAGSSFGSLLRGGDAPPGRIKSAPGGSHRGCENC